MKKTAFTMVELILTIVIMGILASGSYVALSALYTKSAKTKAISQLSFDTTLISNQISSLLSNRVPSTVIGYDTNRSDFESIYNMSKHYNTLEWIGTDYELYMEGNYSGFVDFNQSDKTQLMIFSPDTKDINGSSLIFAGSFDEGSVVYGSDFNNSFGWHHGTANEVFEINATDGAGKLYLSSKPETIYEKYYLLKSAYAIVKYDDNLSICTNLTDIHKDENNLLLFYDYYPWKGETFCGDANVTILSSEANGFDIDFIDGNLQFNLTLERKIRKRGKETKVQISKQKVVF